MVVGMVALLVVGPKELPGLLRTLGKYAGMLKKQAQEFRAQFDEAIQESEFQDIKKDFESIGEEASQSMRDVEATVRDDLDDVDVEFDKEVNLDDDLYNEETAASTPSQFDDDDFDNSDKGPAEQPSSNNRSEASPVEASPVNGSSSATADPEVSSASKSAARAGNADTSSMAAEGKG